MGQTRYRHDDHEPAPFHLPSKADCDSAIQRQRSPDRLDRTGCSNFCFPASIISRRRSRSRGERGYRRRYCRIISAAVPSLTNQPGSERRSSSRQDEGGVYLRRPWSADAFSGFSGLSSRGAIFETDGLAGRWTRSGSGLKRIDKGPSTRSSLAMNGDRQRWGHEMRVMADWDIKDDDEG